MRLHEGVHRVPGAGPYLRGAALVLAARVHQAAEGKEEQQAARLVDGLAPVDLGRLYDLAAVRCRHLLRVGDPRVVGEDALHM